MYNAALSADGKTVICDYGICHLTPGEYPDLSIAAAKCKAAYDAEWYTKKRWDELLTAATVL